MSGIDPYQNHETCDRYAYCGGEKKNAIKAWWIIEIR